MAKKGSNIDWSQYGHTGYDDVSAPAIPTFAIQSNGDPDSLVQDVAKVLSDYGVQIRDYIKGALKAADKIASGKLYDSIEFQVETNGYIITLNILANDYLKWVDWGRGTNKKRPPYTPVNVILEWIKIKGIEPIGTSGIFAPKSKATLLQKQVSLAFMISRSIGINGITPLDLGKGLTPMYDGLTIKVGKMVAASAGEIVKSQFKEAFRAIGNSKITLKTYE